MVADTKKLLGDPYGVLAEGLLKSYLAGKGYTPEKLEELLPADLEKVMIAASVHVSLKLAEIEARSRLRQKIQVKF